MLSAMMRWSWVAACVLVGCGGRTELGFPVEASACPSSPSSPTRVATLAVPSYFGPTGLVVVGSYLYVGLYDGSGKGEIARVSLGTGAADVVSTSYDYAPLVAGSSHLFFATPTVIANDVTAHTLLSAMDVTTTQSATVAPADTPSGLALVNGYAATATGVVWLESAEADTGVPQATFVEQWDGAHAATIAKLPQFGSDVVVGTKDAFVLGGDASGEYFTTEGLYRVPLSGAAPAQMKSFITYESPMLIGTTGNDVIYTPDAVSIVRTSESGDTVLVDKAYVNTCESGIPFCQRRRVWVDDAWVYYVPIDGGISRVHLDGTGQETFVALDSSNPPTAMTSDACNVYWTSTDPNGALPPSVWMKAR